jgi:predicted phosphohydrolase
MTGGSADASSRSQVEGDGVAPSERCRTLSSSEIERFGPDDELAAYAAIMAEQGVRIVAVADTHLYTDDLVVPDGDVLVHAGDLCRGGDLDELEHAATWLLGLPHRHKIVVAGNHDWAFVHAPQQARALLADIVYLQDAGVAIDGVRFWGSPWQPEFHGWAFNLPRGAALAAVWAKIPVGLDVLITHGPPEGIGDRVTIAGRSGCADLRRRVAEVTPRLHLFGHIHQDGGVWREHGTLFANVTTWECERAPTVIDVGDDIVPVVVPPARVNA